MSKTYKIVKTLAIALCNCDPSGLCDDDLKIYDEIDFNFTVIDWCDDSSDINGVCDFTKLHAHCVTIQVDEPILELKNTAKIFVTNFLSNYVNGALNDAFCFDVENYLASQKDINADKLRGLIQKEFDCYTVDYVRDREHDVERYE